MITIEELTGRLKYPSKFGENDMVVMTGHFKKECPLCHTVWSQCRCMNCEKLIVAEICDNCKRFNEEKESAAVRNHYPEGEVRIGEKFTVDSPHTLTQLHEKDIYPEISDPSTPATKLEKLLYEKLKEAQLEQGLEANAIKGELGAAIRVIKEAEDIIIMLRNNQLRQRGTKITLTENYLENHNLLEIADKEYEQS